MNNLNILGVITARGGSKGIARKNIKLLGGKPLIAYTVEQAKQSELITDLIISTDDKEIAQVAEKYGCLVPFLRPQGLARDETPHLPVLQHALREMEKREAKQFDMVVLFQPTSPFRTKEDIDQTIKLLIDSKADSAVSLVEVEKDNHPMKMKKIEEKGGFKFVLPYCLEEPEGIRRQDLPVCFQRSGAVYVQTRELLLEKNRLYGDKIVGHIVPKERSIDIENELDWLRAEHMLKNLKEAGWQF